MNARTALGAAIPLLWCLLAVAPAHGNGRGTITIHNNTSATLTVWAFHHYSRDESPRVTIGPGQKLTLRDYLPRGYIDVCVHPAGVSPPLDPVCEKYWVSGQATRPREWEIFPDLWGKTFIADRPGFDPRPTPPSPSTSYVGCFKDSPDRDLAGYTVSKPTMTTDLCLAECRTRGFAFAATQYGSHCFCDNRYGRHGPSSDCQMPCAGNARETCGGAWANSVYRTAQASPSGPRPASPQPQPRPAAQEPWQTSEGRACIDRWTQEVARRLNQHSGDPQFNARKPWSVNQYGIFVAKGIVSNAPPDDWQLFGASRAQWLWGHHTSELATPDWNDRNFNGASVPGLRYYVRQCLGL